MVYVGSFEAKTHLPALLKRVAKGETVQITLRGVPIANLMPIESDSKHNLPEAARRIRQGRKGVKIGGLTVRGLIDEGRRF